MKTKMTNELLWKRLDVLTRRPQSKENTARFVDLLVEGFAQDLEILMYGYISSGRDGDDRIYPLWRTGDVTEFGITHKKVVSFCCFTDRRYARRFDQNSEVQKAAVTKMYDGKGDEGPMPYLFINLPSCIETNIAYMVEALFCADIDADFLLFNSGTDSEYAISVHALLEAIDEYCLNDCFGEDMNCG